MDTSLTEQEWNIRHFIYDFFVKQGHPPTVEESAAQFVVSAEQMQDIYHRLHQHLTIFLEPDTTHIQIANPLSSVPTHYRVEVNNRNLWANCAWDSLGIAAMLKQDVQVEAQLPLTDEKVHYAVRGGNLEGENYLVHFSLPVREWYNDLIHT